MLHLLDVLKWNLESGEMELNLIKRTVMFQSISKRRKQKKYKRIAPRRSFFIKISNCILMFSSLRIATFQVL